MAQMDAARSFGSAFEQQKIGDQFRVRSLPLVCPFCKLRVAAIGNNVRFLN